MARPSKKNEITEEQIPAMVGEDTPQNSEAATASDEKSEEQIPTMADRLMRLYPHYKELWITEKGFVHPIGVPEYLLKNAKRYKNKYFTNK